MHRLKIGGRLNLVSLAALTGLVVVLALSLLRLDTVMRDDIADRTRKTVETAHSVLVHYQKLESAGAMPRADAQAAALAAIRAMRYGKDEYFWVNDMQPRMVMHPMNPALEGKDVGNNTDADGIYMFREMVKVVQAGGEGFVNYSWDKPGANGAQPKISYVKGFAPWGWMIGSGVYVDEIRAAVMKAAYVLGLAVLAVILAVGSLNWFLSRSISRPVVALTQRMRTLAEGDTGSAIPGLDRRDEVGEMAAALGVFRDAAVAKAAAEAEKAQADAEQQFVVTVVSDRLASLSDGDLTAAISEEFPPAYAALKGNYNTAVGNLRDMMTALANSADAIRTGSGEIAQASEDLARRTEANAASLEETSAALSQMEERLRSTAAAAVHTAGQANEAIAIVGSGRATADEAVGAMGRVSESAQGIDSVIEGLDKIAFQTRVLAMNAAVEAGRAGEAGRGFAVVADLVSALAMRSEEEAKRAREQLTATQSDIVMAVDAVQKVDGALANISGSVEEVHKLVATMASDNQAQSATISEITTAVGAMDQSTQQNAAMVEETSAAARNLAGEVEALSERSSRFRTGAPVAARPRLAASASVAPPRPAPRPLPMAQGSAAVDVFADQDWSSF
ncbi:methyl-accepting chemotaxis protein [Sphingomonas fennica]|uniref:Chemotaxis protein n=1 Tax=Edaphosphingomonas fennica TaxID=114404 RepID=A0A2T4HLK5_9SPHN|nr:cache domain-containing protein [Sphingomonas fennica]PTD16680.1 chemotaxis protein [Sphingomonas fennica]